MGGGMAYRKSNGKLGRRKLQPAVMQIAVQVPTGTSYVDLALCASILNRRSYKQECSEWAVGSFELFKGSGVSNGIVEIRKLPQNWVMENAYTKSKALWHEMNEQVLDEQPSIAGKYRDFKIGMDVNHVAQTIQTNANVGGRILTPIVNSTGGVGNFTVADFTGASAPRADWEFSQLTFPNDPTSGVTTSYTMHAVGASSADSKGLIEGYAASRSRPQITDPNVTTINGWMNELFDDGEQLDDLKDIIEDDNNRPPYPLGNPQTATEFYVGGPNELEGLQVHSFANFTATTVSGKNTIQGGSFKCGLMRIDNSTDGVISMIIHMLPGTHRGYMVEVDA